MIPSTVLVFCLVVIGAFLLLRRIAPSATGPRVLAAKCDWVMSSSPDGRTAHLIPIGDGIAHEEKFGSCACGPTQGNFALDNGLTGWLYIHKTELAEVKR